MIIEKTFAHEFCCKVEQMKELYEEQQRLKLEAELEAYRIKKEQEDKEKKKAKLNEMKPKK